ncbi:predicted protein [Postia placenta Mad-698-R]|uniref:Uncharacterized protein n=1 Tax=Postia placenta MAD-698-R-SB12 TaxID=670580 RepID=A0A1X6NCE2_9APHY|nr:hypothetical protein POSPLADRAFT_1043647 [Postia placenta MAD-698-R-SB12]EED83236.1 predicted protein [Postia placenta Mad-698-R]OSX66162.1 hypothetical protein POSPLADRAFT_1043647 [Postia placenta MAD-698-R-SB12]
MSLAAHDQYAGVRHINTWGCRRLRPSTIGQATRDKMAYGAAQRWPHDSSRRQEPPRNAPTNVRPVGQAQNRNASIAHVPGVHARPGMGRRKPALTKYGLPRLRYRRPPKNLRRIRVSRLWEARNPASNDDAASEVGRIPWHAGS